MTKLLILQANKIGVCWATILLFAFSLNVKAASTVSFYETYYSQEDEFKDTLFYRETVSAGLQYNYYAYGAEELFNSVASVASMVAIGAAVTSVALMLAGVDYTSLNGEYGDSSVELNTDVEPIKNPYLTPFNDDGIDINVDRLGLEVQQGPTCIGNSLFTCLRHMDHPFVSAEDGLHDQRQQFATDFRAQSGADLFGTLDKFNNVAKYHGYSELDYMPHGSSSPIFSGGRPIQAIIYDQVKQGPVIVGIKYDEADARGHAITVLGFLRNQLGFVVADSNLDGLQILHPSTLGKLAGSVKNFATLHGGHPGGFNPDPQTLGD